MHVLTGKAAEVVEGAIHDGSAVLVEAAHFVVDGVVVDHYCLCGRVVRCEYDADYDERRIDEVEGHELSDFMLCHHLI